MASRATCQQVVDDQTGRRCGNPGKVRLGLFAILCDECAAQAERAVRAAWGID